MVWAVVFLAAIASTGVVAGTGVIASLIYWRGRRYFYYGVLPPACGKQQGDDDHPYI